MSNEKINNIINEIIDKTVELRLDVKNIENLVDVTMQYQKQVVKEISKIKQEVNNIEDLIDLMEDERL